MFNPLILWVKCLSKPVCAIFFCVFMSFGPANADPEEGIFAAARIIYESAQNQSGVVKAKSYRRVRSLLDKVLSDHPETDLATRILLQDTIDGVDVTELDDFLQDNAVVISADESDLPQQDQELPDAPDETVSVAVSPSAPHGQSLQSVVQYSISDSTTEDALGLEKNEIRDLQARLLVIGHDSNGVDGVVGRGTRAAIEAWQSSIGAIETGYMSAELLEALKTESEENLIVWLEDPANARKYDPPLIALYPGNMSGSWRYVTNCGTNSKLRKRMRITGTLSMSHAGGRNYSGTLSNSQGLRGRVSATLRGRSVSAVTNFGLLIGKVSLTARVDEDQLVLRGRDSNGCSFYASK